MMIKCLKKGKLPAKGVPEILQFIVHKMAGFAAFRLDDFGRTHLRLVQPDVQPEGHLRPVDTRFAVSETDDTFSFSVGCRTSAVFIEITRMRCGKAH